MRAKTLLRVRAVYDLRSKVDSLLFMVDGVAFRVKVRKLRMSVRRH